MSAKILDGKIAAEALLDSIKEDVQKLDPKLVVVQVGDNPASDAYVRQKFKSCERVGMRSEHIHLPVETTLDELMGTIERLNSDDDVSGFIVQMPLPDALQAHAPQVIRAIDPKKDADGFTAYNLGKVFLSTEFEHLPPATPSGVVHMLEHYEISAEGKHVVILGRSNIVGKPLAVMLINRGATVTVCNSKTKNLKELSAGADILISAIGKPKFVTEDMVKEGAVVIDVGISRTDDGLTGDVDFDLVSKKASAISPVPGGVGPNTVASLVRNCLIAKKRQSEN
ncbi:bifunctional 5,10-methylenetetrahydrofolate dehydrogenase/5,10-methenyltetrahydrofolate cyclohydrolase [Candidatus Peribacteria bacterium]|jgi:methylenetetrahydrofolate dehydrogenase (NADP+) / methenyltetrahydrofolate cyclohydrolase|nr:bifunctional 5,10-methylenetetrahydrofolate dehydrogenase/5,10-methenyltetrahydrofolate cyclohydrolase [Candidatus Peribacteria bacterium]MBT4021254.1 bifunctional 5,10-methylenetetrahydrofolate dehydrogenase/5,10-methenyltetrahydrofolate cyclohydrolase [Candidatus Peribacteria bacterium]MBT4240681.1 bifunctional 5,10-methylenetetrahydrofolate dehydrogenase/5,10-methenyltetrahydrofolate cyclohydrolase [Candidatus Peribacteria bacterium]MBT4474026.1 bifunctional 5,10-methylenetetrahydrofolate 